MYSEKFSRVLIFAVFVDQGDTVCKADPRKLNFNISHPRKFPAIRYNILYLRQTLCTNVDLFFLNHYLH